jgi:hypothetical protein
MLFLYLPDALDTWEPVPRELLSAWKMWITTFFIVASSRKANLVLGYNKPKNSYLDELQLF